MAVTSNYGRFHGTGALFIIFSILLYYSYLVVRSESRGADRRKDWKLVLTRALATRPCSKDGSASQRPKWVQDHVGYASPAIFRKFSVNVQRYNLRKATRAHPGQARNPEHYLAESLKEQKVRMNCDASIQYTVKRRYIKPPGYMRNWRKNNTRPSPRPNRRVRSR